MKQHLLYYALKEYLLSKRMQHWSTKRIKLLQEQRLKNIISHAYMNVPYYRKLMKNSKICPSDIKTLEDLQKIPILTKKDVREHSKKDLLEDGTRKYNVVRTTGSTGMPLGIAQDALTTGSGTGTHYFAFSECGLRILDTIANTIVAEAKRKEKYWFNSLGILRKETIDIASPIDYNLKQLAQIPRAVLYGYPSYIRLLALKNKEMGINPQLRFVITHGELLTDETRKIIERHLNAEVFNTYGSAEFIKIGFECKMHSGLHIVPSGIVVEFLDKNNEPAGEDEEGRIVVTSLYNKVMPLIRYDLGDIGMPSTSTCKCGRTLPLIKNIIGRADDYLILPSGRIISPRNVNLLEGLDGIMEYQTVQKKRDLIVVHVIPNADFTKKTEQQIKHMIQQGCHGEKIAVDVKFVKNIPRQGYGKIKKVVCKAI